MYRKDSKMIEYKSEDQCNALFRSKNKLKIYRTKAASARDTFCHNQKKRGNGACGTIKTKMAIFLAHGKQANKLIYSRKEKNYKSASKLETNSNMQE